MRSTSRNIKRGLRVFASNHIKQTVEVVRRFSTQIKRLHRNVTDQVQKSEEPYCEITQDSACMKILLRLPEVSRRNITVRVSPEKIDVCGRKKGRNLLKTIDLPKVANTEKMRVSYRDERLKITIPYDPAQQEASTT